MSRSKSKSKSNYNSSHSHRSYHHKPKSIPQVFITKLSYYVTKRDLEKEFGKFGEIRNLTLKKGYGFVEYYNKKDAKYAIRELNGRKLFGQSNRIVVEEAKVSRQLREKERRRRRSKSRDKEKDRDKDRDRDKDKDKEDKKENDYYYRRKIGPKKTDICFSCGKEGHWANECQENRRDR
jgi:RNA recognition motif-containing protein